MIVPFVYLIIFLPTLAANIIPLDDPIPSPHNSDSTGIVATSLDHPPLWIDPLASGTFSQSKTPFFNWESLMSSSNINHFPQTGGDIPTFQLGEGIPMDSVQVVENVGQITQEISTAVQTDTRIAQQKDPKASFNNMSNMENVNKPSHEILDLTNPASSTGMFDQDATRLQNNMGIDHRLMSSDNPAAVNPNLLSPDNPTHADLIDFMIAKDMAQGTENVIHQNPIDKDPFAVNPEHENIFEKVPSHDVLPRIETSSSRSSPPDITSIGQENKNTKKQQRQMKQQQRKAENKERKKMQQQQRKSKQLERQQLRQIQQQERQQLRKQQKQQRNKKTAAEKLALRQQKQKARIQQKIEQQLKKLENLETVGLNQQTAAVDNQAFRVNNQIKRLKSRRAPKGQKGKFRKGKRAKGAAKRKSKGKQKN
ncbi:probable serine/threonine-protein kinase irlF [Mytilus trossulus]|uniref:probable serine/threonine-protein kinase irlF n=1 Tax=Mytilus trossulus TaxID=6551 RepID=UPI003005CF60